MLVEGLVLADPDVAPRQGWVRIVGEWIESIGDGPAPRTDDEVAIPFAPGRLIAPGFVDAHTHLPQIDSVGCDGLELLEWLERVVFPAESWWARGGARHMTWTAVRRMLQQGTLAFAGYLVSDAESSAESLRALASGRGLPACMRFIAGRVAMDRNAPEILTQEDRRRAAAMTPASPALPTPSEAAGRGVASVNPRFAIACSEELLAEIGWLVRDRASRGDPIFVQTHLAESQAECRKVAELFPDDAHYTGVYDRLGLLTPRTLLAHCVHLAPEEWRLIREREAVVVHCPTANVFLRSGLFDLDAAREAEVRLALGSDVAAGADVAMPRVARSMIETAKVRRLTVAPSAHIPTPAEAWRLITRGNADALAIPGGARLAPGAPADLLVLRVPDTWVDEHLIGRLIYNWSSRLIERIVVAGRSLDPATI